MRLDPGASRDHGGSLWVLKTGHHHTMLQDQLSDLPEFNANDLIVADSVRNQLSATGYQELRRLDVDVEDGHVKLSGRVARYYLLQVAQKAAMNAKGVLELRNGIKVVK